MAWHASGFAAQMHRYPVVTGLFLAAVALSCRRRRAASRRRRAGDFSTPPEEALLYMGQILPRPIKYPVGLRNSLTLVLFFSCPPTCRIGLWDCSSRQRRASLGLGCLVGGQGCASNAPREGKR